MPRSLESEHTETRERLARVAPVESTLAAYEAGKREIAETAQTSAEYEARITALAEKCGV